ncbi:DUF6597 domain-containing transcriptional factor [Streptomyces sp. NPDC058045]|uniref:DUF6597 domain-containing transcriptional factor n=1 Tax=Streptomyces sp. NPDC058045 TaxID=3346311 RepID=UPI0036EDEAC4
MAAAPRRDTRGIVDAAGLLRRVRFRRRTPAPALRPYLEHYWLIDWDLPEPYTTHVLPHPSVNLVFQRYGTDADPGEPFAELAGVGRQLDSRKLAGRGRVCGVQFRPGGFRPFAPGAPVSAWTGRHLPARQVLPGTAEAAPGILDPRPLGDDDARVAALDRLLLGLGPAPDPGADLAMALVDRIRTDRDLRRVTDLAAEADLSVRALQRLFATRVGVSPKWVILRYRIHEALDHAERGTGTDWAALAAGLGYADQAHLVRDFTHTLGVSPTAYAGAPGG